MTVNHRVLAAILMKAPPGPAPMPGRAKPKTGGTSRSPKPRKATTKRKGPSKAGAKAKPGQRPLSKVDASARIDKEIADLGDWRGERLAEIRKLIHEVDPGVVEEWKWMGTPVWSNEGMYASANAHKDKVKLTFHHGARLPDPNKLFNAGLDGNQWRAIDVREADRIDQAALKDLLRAAIAHNQQHTVPKSRGSRDI